MYNPLPFVLLLIPFSLFFFSKVKLIYRKRLYYLLFKLLQFYIWSFDKDLDFILYIPQLSSN